MKWMSTRAWWMGIVLLLHTSGLAQSTSQPVAPLEVDHPVDYLPSSTRIVLSEDRFCGPYVVWHALNLRGEFVPINDLVREMRAERDGYVTIAAVVQALRNHGFDARAVKMMPDELLALQNGFILYLNPAMVKRAQMGHFSLCVPNVEPGSVTIVDGARVPQTVPKATFPNSLKEAGWDGSAILLSSSNRLELSTSLRQHVLYYVWMATAAVGILWGMVRLFSRKEERDFDSQKEGTSQV